jgi:hypothetical protein
MIVPGFLMKALAVVDLCRGGDAASTSDPDAATVRGPTQGSLPISGPGAAGSAVIQAHELKQDDTCECICPAVQCTIGAGCGAGQAL